MSKTARLLVPTLMLVSGCALQVAEAEPDAPPIIFSLPPVDTCSSKAAPSAGWDGGSPSVAAGSDASLAVAFSLAEGRPLKSIAAVVQPAQGHALLPERLPWFSLFDGVDTVGTAFDPSADLPAYAAEHEVALDLSAFSFAAEPGHEQHARFVSEGGAGAVDGLRVLAWRCAY